jgi:hypothetical protein
LIERKAPLIANSGAMPMMNSLQRLIEGGRVKLQPNFTLLALVAFHSVVCCVSLALVSDYQAYIPYNPDRMLYAAAVAAAFSSISLFFVLARFSFGYFVGFYFYTMILGFLWIDVFSQYQYEHRLAGFSAAVSLLLFLMPALSIRAPLKRVLELSPQALERLLKFAVMLAVVTVALASSYNFKLISLAHIYDFRSEIEFPTVVRYLVTTTSDALLPFAFAGFLTLNRRWWATATLLLMLFYYPITLSKFAFFAPAWIIAMLALSKLLETRVTIILSLLVPMLVGIILILTVPTLYTGYAYQYFNLVNIRMIATPSSAIDIYNDFFSYHPFTYFCQISFLTSLTDCPYRDQLAVVMQNAYGFGNLNASLFATEGVASVGLVLAPLGTLACGFVIALGNRVSAGLPPRFVLISGALLPQALLNVPLTTGLLTHGAAVLFLLWYIMPRAVFETA